MDGIMTSSLRMLVILSHVVFLSTTVYIWKAGKASEACKWQVISYLKTITPGVQVSCEHP